MNIVITMAGLGSRFKKAGYSVPKYMIEVHGKSLFEWSMRSLSDFSKLEANYFFIVRKEDRARSYINEQLVHLSIEKYEIIEIYIAKTAEIESKSIYAKRKPKKKPRNPASDEGREMMANNNYHQVKEKV